MADGVLFSPFFQYNNTDLRNATAEEAAYELARPAEKVQILAQYNPEREWPLV